MNRLIHWIKRYTIERAFQHLDTEQAQGLYRHIAQIIEGFRCSSVLDVGCWHGNLLKHLHGPRFYCGFDLAIPAIERARRLVREGITTDIRVGDLNDLPIESRQFDVIYFGGIVGYLSSEDEFLTLFERYVHKHRPRYVIVQEPPNQFDIDRIIDRLRASKYVVVRFDQLKLEIRCFAERKILVLSTRQTVDCRECCCGGD